MCKTVSFLSGKGGSGKTTLALSMASMLSRFGVKVLLVDCDLSTNGATYFYEHKLSPKPNDITSFYDLLFSPYLPETTVIKIDRNYDFMPSVTQISSETAKSFSCEREDTIWQMNRLLSQYDVVLFDCQAGYTDILKLILPITDVNLVVMEPDAISSSAVRSLLLKIGEMIDHRKVYQVFNKASEEEYEIYSKVSGGLLFTNIETIRFDWKIRKAFSLSQIPDFENTSANYGAQLYNVCKAIFLNDSIRKKLLEYEYILQYRAYQETEARLEEIMNSQYKDRTTRQVRLSLIVALLFSIMLALVIFIINRADLLPWSSSFKVEENIDVMVLILIMVTAMGTFSSSLFETYKENREKRKAIKVYLEKLEEISIAKKELQKKMRSTEVKQLVKQ